MKIRKMIYIGLGCIGVALGAVGAALPILPSFPFLLLAAFCFAKSSKRLHDWFVGTKLYRNNLESYVKGRGMTWKTKIRIMAMVTLTMSVGFLLMSRVPVGRIVLACVWVFHIIYFVFGVKTIHPGEGAEYLHRRILQVEDLQGKRCARKLENALNQNEQMRAEVDASSQTATIYCKHPVDEHLLVQMVRKAGYRARPVGTSK